MTFEERLDTVLEGVIESWLRRSDAPIDARIVHYARIAPVMLAQQLSPEELYDLGYCLHCSYVDPVQDNPDIFGDLAREFNLPEHQHDYFKELSDEIWLEALKAQMGDVPLKNIRIIGKYNEADLLRLEGTPFPSHFKGLPVLAYLADTNLKQFFESNDWREDEAIEEDYFFKILKRY